MLFDFLSILVRVYSAIPVSILLFIFLLSVVKTRDLNGLSRTRNALVVLFIGVAIELLIRLIGDSHLLMGLTKTSQLWLTNAKWFIWWSAVIRAVGFTLVALLFVKRKRE
jgi:hypothetical protein